MTARVDDLADLAGLPLVIKDHAKFRKLEVERTILEAKGAHARCHDPRLPHHRSSSRIAAIVSIQHGLCFFIRKLSAAVDDSIDKFGFGNVAVVINL